MKKTYLCAEIVAFAILLTGCGGNTSGSSGATSQDTTSQSTAANTSDTSISDTEPVEIPTAEPVEIPSAEPVEIPSAEPPSTDPFIPTAETVEPFVPQETTVHVDYAQEDYVNGAVDEFNIPEDFAGVRVLFTTNKTVSDFKILHLTCETIDDDGNITFAVEETYSQPELTPDRPLVAGLEFPGDMPSNGISYVDADGVTRNFAVDMSGMDGSLFLWEF